MINETCKENMISHFSIKSVLLEENQDLKIACCLSEKSYILNAMLQVVRRRFDWNSECLNIAVHIEWALCHGAKMTE